MVTLLLTFLLSVQALALPSINKDGERVSLQRSLVEGKKNIIFFHAPWSKTSSRYKVELEKWQKKHSEIAVLQVNVTSLKSPVAKQYKLKAVPAFGIFDGEGKLMSQGQEAQNSVIKLLSE